MIGNALLVVVSFVVGWIALWPARRALGAWDYHLAALPVGLVGWTAASGAAGMLARGMHWPIVLPAMLAYVAGIFLVLRLWVCRDQAQGEPPALWSYLLAGAVVALATVAATASRLTIEGYDSWSHYQLAGIYLADHGRPTASILGEFGALIPSVIAAGRMLGGDWIYAIYPVMALNLWLAAVGASYRASTMWVSRRAGMVLAALVGFVLLFTRWFEIHAFYVHSQMYSALFLFVAVVPPILLAMRRELTEQASVAGVPSRQSVSATLVVSGIATAGLALTRPDGLVYVFVAMLVVLGMRFQRGWPARHSLDFAGPLLAVLVATYAGAFLRLGLWQSIKLSGRTTLLVIALIAVIPVAAEALFRWEKAAWLGRGRNALRVFLALDALGVLGAAGVARKRFLESVGNMLTNLFSTGGYGYLWYFVAGVVFVTLVLGILRCGDGPVYTLFAMAQFFAVALVVHGVAHPGRLSPADSFNRVAFHIVPIALWYTSAALAVFWSSRTAGKDAS